MEPGVKDQLDAIEKKVDEIGYSLKGTDGAIGLISRVKSIEEFVRKNRVPAAIGRLILYPSIGAIGLIRITEFVIGG